MNMLKSSKSMQLIIFLILLVILKEEARSERECEAMITLAKCICTLEHAEVFQVDAANHLADLSRLARQGVHTAPRQLVLCEEVGG
jgi:hypothetical protein